MENLVYLLIGIACGAVAGAAAVFMILRNKSAGIGEALHESESARVLLEAEVGHLRESAEGLRAEITRKEEAAAAREKEFAAELENIREKLSSVSEAKARLETGLEQEKKSAAEKLAVYAEAEKKLREAFSALSAQALEKNSNSFLELAKTSLEKYQQSAKDDLTSRQKSIGELVKPIRESLTKVDERIREVEKARNESFGAIVNQMKTMAEGTRQLQGETANLVKALRAPQVRGRWGEVQLKRVVELAGMLDRCDFVEQMNVGTEDGRLRPDMVINLPGGKTIIVDAKTPLAAYLEAVEAQTDEERDLKMREHARQVRTHIDQLGRKSYWDQFDTAPDFVIMFLPGESFYSSALQYDPLLLEHGVESRVFLASPTSLITLLRAVAYGWQQEKIAENAEQISALGKDLYERVAKMADHFSKLGKSISTTVNNYNSALGSLESRVLPSARKFEALGISSKAEIPTVDGVDKAVRIAQASELTASAETEE